MNYESAEFISLKNHPQFNEAWLQQILIQNPELLGLGELEFREAERRQISGGRLDLLFVDQASRTRYEVEVQLGATDASHIIRTIEYWDLERNKYPNWEHVAVLIAEEVTSRFLNVISLFNKSIPIILIQIKAVQIGNSVTLVPTTVLNLSSTALEDDDESRDEPTDRNYWAAKGTPETLKMVDELLEIINEIQENTLPKYNKHYIGLLRSGIVNNYVIFKPKKEMVVTEFRLPRAQEIDSVIENSGLDSLTYSKQWGRYRLRLYKSDLQRSREIIKELFVKSAGQEIPQED